MKIMVYATHPNSLNIAHPVDGKLNAAGSHWENDSFTFRMLSDGAVTTEPPRAPPPADPPPKK